MSYRESLLIGVSRYVLMLIFISRKNEEIRDKDIYKKKSRKFSDITFVYQF